MANRPVFVVNSKPPYYKLINVEFKWSGGFAKCQSQKNIVALHNNFLTICPEYKILEISSKSMQELGTKLSAFSLVKYVPEIDAKIPVECIYQSSKVFSNGGPYTDLNYKTPKEAKTDERLKNSGHLIGYRFGDVDYPLTDNFTFYDYIYILALMENPALQKELLQYSAFTDIIFTPNKSLNCQAKSCAIFKSLYDNGLLDYASDFNKMASLGGWVIYNNYEIIRFRLSMNYFHQIQ